jgi:hypothetical protein
MAATAACIRGWLFGDPTGDPELEFGHSHRSADDVA